MQLDNKKSVLLIESAVQLKRTIAMNLIMDGSCKLVGSVGNLYEGYEKIQLVHPGIIIIGVENMSAQSMFQLERFIKECMAHKVIIVADDLPQIKTLLRSHRMLQYVQRPDKDDFEGINKTAKAISDSLSTKRPEELAVAPPKRKPVNVQPMPVVPADAINPRYKDFLIAIGASTGGTEAIFSIITKMTNALPPIVIVQHMPPVFTKMYADRLNMNCALEVREAVNGDLLYPGLALVAPGDLQLRIVKRGHSMSVECIEGEKISGHCPSVDNMFQSVATALHQNAIGILLTGMGKDGANGLLEMHQKGARTIGQDPESCVVYGMPKVAFDIGAVDIQATPDKIPEIVNGFLQKMV